MKRTAGIAALALAQPVDAVPSSAIPQPPRAIAGIPVYVAVDLGSHQVLAAREPDRAFQPASMAKAMTAYVAFELMAEGKLLPAQRLVVRPETAAKWQGRGTSLGLTAGEQVSVDMLLQGITTASANDAAVVLAEGAAGSIANWLALMNVQARKLGMTASHFATPNGWPDGGATRVSANDLVKLGRALVERHPRLYHRYFGKQTLTWNGVNRHNHDPTLGTVPGADGIKTGHTAAAGYNFLGTALRGGRRIMIVIGGAASEAQRAKASRELLEWGFSAWETRRLFAQGAKVAQVQVQQGEARWVDLVARYDASVTVPRAAHPQIEVTLHYRGPLIAPVRKGSQVGSLEVSVPGQPTATLPLVAASGIGRAGPFDRLRNGLTGLFR